MLLSATAITAAANLEQPPCRTITVVTHRPETLTQTPQASLLAIEQALDQGTYRKGPWQALTQQVEQMPLAERQRLAPDLDRVSNKLHGQQGHQQWPLLAGLLLEGALLMLGLQWLDHPDLLPRIVAVGAITLSLQPAMKLVMGLLLGVRYSYMYLWYVEPRFKLRYGTYLALPAERRVMFHLAGSLGTPIALFIGYQALASVAWLAALCLVGCGITALMQVAAFVASWRGVRKVGPFLLTSLTTPATLARELKALRDRQKD